MDKKERRKGKDERSKNCGVVKDALMLWKAERGQSVKQPTGGPQRRVLGMCFLGGVCVDFRGMKLVRYE